MPETFTLSARSPADMRPFIQANLGAGDHDFLEGAKQADKAPPVTSLGVHKSSVAQRAPYKVEIGSQ